MMTSIARGVKAAADLENLEKKHKAEMDVLEARSGASEGTASRWYYWSLQRGIRPRKQILLSEDRLSSLHSWAKQSSSKDQTLSNRQKMKVRSYQHLNRRSNRRHLNVLTRTKALVVWTILSIQMAVTNCSQPKEENNKGGLLLHMQGLHLA